MGEMDRRKFIKLAFLALAAGCAPKTNVKDSEEEFVEIYEGRKRRAANASRPTRRLKLPDRKFPEPSGELDILPRSTWTTARPINSRLDLMGTIYRMTVHHEGNPQPNYDVAMRTVEADLELIRKVHLERMRAGDIGYHYVIDRAGRIWEGRNLMYQGAHVGGQANAGNIGVVLLGNFDIQYPSEAQRGTLKKFLIYLKDTYHISHSHIYTHQELKPSRCPGVHLQAYMNELRRTYV